MIQGRRYFILDSFRGICIVGMVLYHALWDLMYIFNYSLPWFESTIASIWQESI